MPVREVSVSFSVAQATSRSVSSALEQLECDGFLPSRLRLSVGRALSSPKSTSSAEAARKAPRTAVRKSVSAVGASSLL